MPHWHRYQLRRRPPPASPLARRPVTFGRLCQVSSADAPSPALPTCSPHHSTHPLPSDQTPGRAPPSSIAHRMGRFFSLVRSKPMLITWPALRSAPIASLPCALADCVVVERRLSSPGQTALPLAAISSRACRDFCILEKYNCQVYVSCRTWPCADLVCYMHATSTGVPWAAPALGKPVAAGWLACQCTTHTPRDASSPPLR